MQASVKKGMFITVDGPDGSGKTTVISELKKRLQLLGITTTITREPGGVNISEQIRQVILDNNNVTMDARTEALLYAAARRQHLVEKIIPKLSEGHLVLCDRFLDSSLVYQGYARGLGISDVLQINRFAISDFEPECTFFLMVSPLEGRQRIRNYRRNTEIDRLDAEGINFHKLVYEGYEMLAKMYSERIRVVDASQSLDTVVEELLDVINNLLSKKG